MDTTTDYLRQRQPAFTLVRGEFAPVFWEPLGARGERLVVGVLLGLNDAPCKAYITLEHNKLLEFITQERSESAVGIIRFAFDFFNKTLGAGGLIQDLKSPFAAMSIGRTEAIAGRDEKEVLERATRLCTLLGHMPTVPVWIDPNQVVARTAGFLRSVRTSMRLIDSKLARESMKAKQVIFVGASQLRVHFHHQSNFVQFCSLPLPNAKVETATECAARLNDLILIQRTTSNANVALCINTDAVKLSSAYTGKVNATKEIQARTLDYARVLGIQTLEYDSPREAAHFLTTLV